MKKQAALHKSVLMPALLGALAAVPASGQEARPLNRFDLGYRAGFNIKASFKDLNPATFLSDPGPAIAGVNHNYADGYNRVDISGNAGNQTWYWGYQNAVQTPGDGNIYMHSAGASPQPAASDVSNDPLHGAQLTYSRELGMVGSIYWGVEAAANYTALEISQSKSSLGSFSLTTDRYSLGGIIPPQPPYFGTFQGPNPDLGEPNRPVISDIPNRTVELATGTAESKVESDIYGFRLGPYLEYPFNERFSAGLSGGLALAVVDSEFSFREIITGAGVGKSLVRSGRDSTDDLLVGGYVGGKIMYKATRALSVFVGAEWQDIGSMTQRVNNRESRLDMSNGIFLNAGLGFSF